MLGGFALGRQVFFPGLDAQDREPNPIDHPGDLIETGVTPDISAPSDPIQGILERMDLAGQRGETGLGGAALEVVDRAEKQMDDRAVSRSLEIQDIPLQLVQQIFEITVIQHA